MRHLRDSCQVDIRGSYQKKQLISYGYYHGYKGYRFVKKSSQRISYSKFKEVVAVIEYDNRLKAALYQPLMFMETAIKNVVCNETLTGMGVCTFDGVYVEKMNDNPLDRKLRAKRLRLRNALYSHISDRYRREEHMDNQMVRHFYDRGDDVPLWVVFEFMYLSDLANFFDCLNGETKSCILETISLRDKALDTSCRLLSDMLYTMKGMRNAVAHNNIIFDARVKDRTISKILKKWIERETGIQNISLNSVIDYIIILCSLLKRIDFSNERMVSLVSAYKLATEKLRQEVTDTIYKEIIQQNVERKLQALEIYIHAKS